MGTMETVQRILARVGATAEVPLEAAPGGGYLWEVSLPDEGRHLIDVLEQVYERTGPPVGAPVVQRFRFRLLGPGEVPLVFRYRRPWENVPAREDRSVLLRIEARSEIS